MNLGISLTVSRALRRNTSFLATSCQQRLRDWAEQWTAIAAGTSFCILVATLFLYLACSLCHQACDLHKVIEGGYKTSAYPELHLVISDVVPGTDSLSFTHLIELFPIYNISGFVSYDCIPRWRTCLDTCK